MWSQKKIFYVKIKHILSFWENKNNYTHDLSSLVYPPAHSSFHDQTVLLAYVLWEAVICLFHLPVLVYEAIMKESGLNDLESKHLAKKAKHSHNDTG